jgi:DNA-binding helix-hairpin-helix protein with protein kinase domain
VPEFTPPELQGKDFGNVTRTPQHDAFGLSILIFYLLFLGRHPFMGLYDVKSDDIVSLDSAISLYKFPYSLGSGSSEVRLPSFVPRLADYPSELGNLFIRAFTRDALTRGRPTATEWVGSLSNLSKALKTCKTNPNHQFFSGIGDCPWCRAEGALGTPIFGIKVAIVGDHGFNLIAVWVEIEKVKPVPEPLQKPELDRFRDKYGPDPTIKEIAHKRRVHRLGAIGIVFAVSVLSVVAGLVPLAAIAAITIALIVAGQVWKRGNIGAKPFIEQYESVLKIYREAETEFDRSSAPPVRCAEIQAQLDLCKREYEGLGSEKAKRLAKLNSEREAKQRQRFLETFRIEDATIPNIGPKNKLILRTWGIEDAWDVDEGRIQTIKGFGPVKITSLMEWRRSKERLFRFDSKQPVDPRDLNALEQEFAQKAQNLESVITQGLPNLRQAISVWHAQRRQLVSKLSILAEKFAAADVNRRALGRL